MPLQAAGAKGVVLDVEPYLTDGWKDRTEVLRRYVDGMCRAREAADRAGIELIACIPYFYDKDGTEELERLVSKGCHSFAVMNYDRKKEVSHLKTEAGLAAAYGRPLFTICELQKPGTHGLTERNTYYALGPDGVRESWKELRGAYPDQPFSYALHDSRSLKEVLRLA